MLRVRPAGVPRQLRSGAQHQGVAVDLLLQRNVTWHGDALAAVAEVVEDDGDDVDLLLEQSVSRVFPGLQAVCAFRWRVDTLLLTDLYEGDGDGEVVHEGQPDVLGDHVDEVVRDLALSVWEELLVERRS